MRFIEAYPAADGDPLQPLVAADVSASVLHPVHRKRRNLGSVHALGVWEATNLRVMGFPSHLYVDGERFSHPSVEPGYVGALIEQDRVDPLSSKNLPDHIIEETVVVFVGWGREVYGHALVDIAPRVAIAEKALGCARDELRFLLPADAPHWFREVLALTGARNFVEYSPRECNALVRHGYVATLPWQEALHPACREIFAQMRPPEAGLATEFIYITRRNATVTRKINMRNVEEIEAIAASAGLRIVAPEQLSVGEQARLFAEARLIVGEYGSALMSAVFCRPGAIVAAIGVRSGLLSAISAVNDLRAAFMTPAGDVNDPNGYDVDPEAFSRWLGALVDAARSGGAE